MIRKLLPGRPVQTQGNKTSYVELEVISVKGITRKGKLLRNSTEVDW